MPRISSILAAVLAVALVAVALESELPQRVAARLGLWAEVLHPRRDIDVVSRDLQAAYPTRHADIVMLGDSLTAEADWQELLPGRDVVNRGVAGETTTEIAARADAVLRLNPRVVFVLAGTNDLMIGRSPAEIAASYSAILDGLKTSSATIVVQPVVHVAHDRGPLGLQRFWYNRRNDRISELNRLLRDAAAQRGLRFLDLNTILAPAGELPDNLTIDGTHLRAAAYLLWAAEVERELDAIDAKDGVGQASTKTDPGRT